MESKVPEERRASFLEKVRMVTEADVLELEDMRKIMEICIDAARRKEAGIAEEMLIERLRGGS